jgi:MFS family permease
MGEMDTAPHDDCPLSVREQTRNVLIVAGNTALSYLAAPVTYVDSFHAALLNDLQANAGQTPSDALSNLPQSMYMVFGVLPLFVAWAFPQIRLMRRIVLWCYLTMTLASAVVVATLVLPLAWWLQAAVIVAHGAVMGGARTVGVAIEFEVLGVAVAERRRGQALGLAYGFGPLLAIVGNLVIATLLVTGKLQFHLFGQIWGFASGAYPFPANYAALFGYTIPVLGLAAFLCSRLIIPLPEKEVVREPFLEGVFGGLGEFLGRPVVRLAIISSIAIFCGHQVIANMTLYAGALFGGSPSETAGFQKAALYTCKVAMGLSMGWLLTRASPRSAVLISAAAGLVAVVFAIFSPPNLFYWSFAILGAGQLYGIYITNYILSCAPKSLMRRYMAFLMLTGLLIAPAGYIYGAISDYFGPPHYTKQFGYRMSFVAAAALIALGMVLSLLLPARPKAVDGGKAVS